MYVCRPDHLKVYSSSFNDCFFLSVSLSFYPSLLLLLLLLLHSIFFTSSICKAEEAILIPHEKALPISLKRPLGVAEEAH